jgi:AMIN domain
MTVTRNKAVAVPLQTQAEREPARQVWWMTAATMLMALVLTFSWRGVQAQEANSIESVTSALQGSSTYLKIVLKETPKALPVGFTVTNPPRIALDFLNTDNHAGQTNLEMSQGDVRNVAIVQATTRSRLVMNLKRAMTYTAEIEGNQPTVGADPTTKQLHLCQGRPPGAAFGQGVGL